MSVVSQQRPDDSLVTPPVEKPGHPHHENTILTQNEVNSDEAHRQDKRRLNIWTKPKGANC
jgi:hypothetical protein